MLNLIECSHCKLELRMAKTKKSKASKTVKKNTGMIGLVDSISNALLGSNIEIKLNGHELIKDKENNISYSVTKDNVKTAVHYRDKGFGFERKTINQPSDIETEANKIDNK